MKINYLRITAVLLLALMVGFMSCTDEDIVNNVEDNDVITWLKINTNLQGDVSDLQFVSDDVGYAKVIAFEGWGNKLTKTTDGGFTWFDIPFPAMKNEYSVEDFSFQNADTGYVILSSNPHHVEYTFNGGISWDSVYIDLGFASQLIATNNGKVYFTVSFENNVKLYKTEDHFQSWNHLYDFPEGVFGEFKCLSTDDAAFFAFNNWEGKEAYIFKVYNDVVDQLYFTAKSQNNYSVFITALYFQNKDSGFFVLSEKNNNERMNTIFKTTDFGSSYEIMATIPDGTAGGDCLYFNTVTNGWAGTGNGQIFKVKGSVLTQEFQNYDYGIRCFSRAEGSQNLYFGGSGGTMGKYILPSDIY